MTLAKWVWAVSSILEPWVSLGAWIGLMLWVVKWFCRME